MSTDNMITTYPDILRKTVEKNKKMRIASNLVVIQTGNVSITHRALSLHKPDQCDAYELRIQETVFTERLSNNSQKFFPESSRNLFNANDIYRLN
jgi:hypothetical protein